MDWKVRLRYPLITLLFLVPLTATAALEPGDEDTLLVVGDSLSAAYNMPEEDGWVALLSQRIRDRSLPWHVINASVGGETTEGGRARLDGLLERHEPDLVVLQLGGNDGLRGVPVSRIRDNLDTMIRRSRETGAEVLLIGIRLPPNYGSRYTQPFFAQYRELSDEYGIPLLPFLLEGIADNRELMQADGIHPTDEAQPMILERVWPVLHPML